MGISGKIKKALRGGVPFYDLPLEVLRRIRAANRRRTERRLLEQIQSSPARLLAGFESLTAVELLTHFRKRQTPVFWPGQVGERDTVVGLQSELFPEETVKLIGAADRIVNDSSWELAGFGILSFNADSVWRRDPLSLKLWGLEYHHDLELYQNDGSDIRVLWELNRFGHSITLATAFAVTGDENYAETFFSHVESWTLQNPMGRGANWNCAMEVALRSINLLAAFDIFRHSGSLTESRLEMVLGLVDRHARFIFDNNEFSYIATSNHYLSDVVGLFWIGVLMPELKHARQWKEFGLREMLREMDKQIMADGSDFEASTGYHKFVTELLFYSFLLAKHNDIEIPGKYWGKLRSMLEYLKALIRPDGRTPLIGDADASQIIPVVKRDADDQVYLAALGAAFFQDPRLKESVTLSPEVLWILGEKGIKAFESVDTHSDTQVSEAFPDGGAYIMRLDDLYLHLNANDCGVGGRGSHAHNDALGIEISALGRSFIVDPGSYVYNLDRQARQQFRSTLYHSTVMVDGMEQNTTDVELPFVLGNEAQPSVTEWQTSVERDVVSAEHFGYMRLPDPVLHRRRIELDKVDKYWLITDLLSGDGEHTFSFGFHLASGLGVNGIDRETVKISDDDGRGLYIRAIGFEKEPQVVPAFASRNYGYREESARLAWELMADAPFTARFIIVPVGPDENIGTRLELLGRVTDNIDN